MKNSLSQIANKLRPPAVLEVLADLARRRAAGHATINLTVGDFGPEFQPPPLFLAACHRALLEGHTNYPPSKGIKDLRVGLSRWYERRLGLSVDPDDVIVAAGARPLLYAAYRTLLDPGDVVLDPTPSFNNQAYAGLVGARRVPIATSSDAGFLLDPEDLAPHLDRARLLVLCSPSNPAGTMFEHDRLREIAALVVDENGRRRGQGRRALFVLWDQIYWQTALDAQPLVPSALLPELAPYLVVVDGGSKSLAATGLRLGWAVAANEVSAAMAALLDHVGAWAPHPFQCAMAEWLSHPELVDEHAQRLAAALGARRSIIEDGLTTLAREGWPVSVVHANAGLYVLAKVATPSIPPREWIHRLLDRTGLGVVPIEAFGVQGGAEAEGWFRVAVATATVSELEAAPAAIRRMLTAQTTGFSNVASG